MRISKISLRWFALALCIILVAGALFYYEYVRPMQAFSYFQHAAQTISENVTVAGITYHVENGTVTGTGGTSPSQDQQLAALRLSYALTLARRSPILDLEGTDPTKLRTAIADLANVQQTIIAAQASSTGKQLIGALYPLSFLSALADLEQARQTFIASGKDTDEQAYEAKLTAAIAAGSADIKTFKSAYDQTGHPTYELVKGTVQGSAIDQELQSISDGFDSINQAAQKRSSCISGNVADCDISDIAITLPAEPLSTSTSPVPSLVQQIVTIYAATRQESTGRPLVELNDSACMGNLDVPQYFLLDTEASTSPIQFVGDMFFNKADSGSIPGLFENLGASYGLYSPMTYYTCLESGQDLARAQAVWNIAQALNPSSTQAVADEAQESGVLQAAITEATPMQLQNLLPEYLMMKDNSASFDQVVESIAAVESIEPPGVSLPQQNPEGGTPARFDPSFLFSAKSGFYDLFLAYNPSAGSKPVDLYTSTTTNPLIESLLPWSQLRNSVSVAKIEHDIDVYITFHINPQSLDYALPPPPASAIERQPPAGEKLYQNNAYDFSLFYPDDLTVTEQSGSGSTVTILFQDSAKQEGFQIFAVPYGQPKITQQRFETDEPSGVMNDPANITIDGAPATEFFSTNTAMGASREIWFIHNGLLYEVTAPEPLDSWLLKIMESWQFL